MCSNCKHAYKKRSEQMTFLLLHGQSWNTHSDVIHTPADTHVEALISWVSKSGVKGDNDVRSSDSNGAFCAWK